MIDIGPEDRTHYKSIKSGRARTIRIPSFLVPLLGKAGATDELVFGTATNAPLRFDNFRTRVWSPAIEQARKADPKFPPTLRFHDLRHTCASVLIDAGYNAKAIQAHMGDSAIAVTFDTYGHLFDDWHDDIPDVLDRIHAEAPC